MAFQWYTFLLLNPVWNIVNSFSELQRSLAAMERVFEVLAMADDKPDRPDARDAPRVVARDRVRGRRVRVSRRPAGRARLQRHRARRLGGRARRPQRRGQDDGDRPGRALSRSDAGPDPAQRHRTSATSGCKTYRDLLAIVQQDVFLFDGSVRDNIAYGRHDATDAEVEDAARRANAHEFIDKLPERYDTFVGERGVKLSGGQQQRLAIARAILASPQILILDEATSNLDTESEQLIQASMATLLAGRTTFVIAHRLSTIRRADPDPADGGRPHHRARHARGADGGARHCTTRWCCGRRSRRERIWRPCSAERVVRRPWCPSTVVSGFSRT